MAAITISPHNPGQEAKPCTGLPSLIRINSLNYPKNPQTCEHSFVCSLVRTSSFHKTVSRQMLNDMPSWILETQFSSDGVWVLGLYESLYSTFKRSLLILCYERLWKTLPLALF